MQARRHTHTWGTSSHSLPRVTNTYMHVCVCIYIYCYCNVRHNTLPCSLRRGNPRTGITVCVCPSGLLSTTEFSPFVGPFPLTSAVVAGTEGDPNGRKKKQKQRFKQPSRACVCAIWSPHLLTSVSLSLVSTTSLSLRLLHLLFLSHSITTAVTSPSAQHWQDCLCYKALND